MQLSKVHLHQIELYMSKQVRLSKKSRYQILQTLSVSLCGVVAYFHLTLPEYQTKVYLDSVETL